MDEDWDAEITGSSPTVPTQGLKNLSLNGDTKSTSDRYFDDDFEEVKSKGTRDNNGYVTQGRGRGRGLGRGQKESFSWNQNGEGRPVQNGFGNRSGGFSNRGNSNNNYQNTNDNENRGSFGNRGGFDRNSGGFNNRNNSQNNGYDNNNRSGFGSRGGFENRNNFRNDSNENNRQGGFGSSGGFGNRSDGGDKNQEDEVLTMEVINDSIGKVIGKGGTKIREIQSVSGANVRILQDEASLSVTPIELRGTEEQKAKAKQMIEDVTIPAGDLRSWAQKENREYEETHVNVPMINWGALKEEAAEFERQKWADCPEIKKEFYDEKPHISQLDPLEVATIRSNKMGITVEDLSEGKKKPVPNPLLKFPDAFDQYPEIMETINENKFTEPSPIQCQAWPVIMSGRDCIGIAQTGTGKTLAFLLPAFIHIDEQPVSRRERGGPSCLVLSPTRELAQQIEMEVKKFHYRGIRSVCIYGGGDRRQQIQMIKNGVEIVIGTPGRLNDLLMNNFFNVKSVTYLVLDEADRMLDMGFEPEIKKILLDIRPDRQTIMTSATWPPSVQRMADKYLVEPVRVNVGSMDLAACHSVTQLVEFIEFQDKQARVFDFLHSMGPEDKLIIFVGRKVTADDISSNIAMRGVPVGVNCIHGDREQSDREQALEDMKTGRCRVLIATDVASRGLDIKDLTHVLNYDFPRHIEDYVHRIGRTGRAGRSGVALTFVTREDWMHVGKLIPIMEEAGQEIPDELVEMAERWRKKQEERNAYGGGGRRGGGGGGGGGGGNGCFKCGKEGHFSRECPEGGGGGGRGGGGRGFGGGRGGGGGFGGGGFGGGRGGGGRGGRGRRERGGITIASFDAV